MEFRSRRERHKKPGAIIAGFAVGGGGGGVAGSAGTGSAGAGAGLYQRRLPPVLGVQGSHIVDIRRRMQDNRSDDAGEDDIDDDEMIVRAGRRRNLSHPSSVGATQTEFSYQTARGAAGGGGPVDGVIRQKSNERKEKVQRFTSDKSRSSLHDAASPEASSPVGRGVRIDAGEPEIISVSIPPLVQVTDGLYTTTVARSSKGDAKDSAPAGFWRETLIARLKAKRASMGQASTGLAPKGGGGSYVTSYVYADSRSVGEGRASTVDAASLSSWHPGPALKLGGRGGVETGDDRGALRTNTIEEFEEDDADAKTTPGNDAADFISIVQNKPMYLKRINRDGSEQEIVLRNFNSFNAFKFNLRGLDRFHLARVSHINNPQRLVDGERSAAAGASLGNLVEASGPFLSPVLTKGERHLLERFDPNEVLKGKFLPSQHLRYNLPPPEPPQKRGLQAPWPASPPECAHGTGPKYDGENPMGPHALNIRCMHGSSDSTSRRKRHGHHGPSPGDVNDFSAWRITPPPPDAIPSSPDRPPLWLHREISFVGEFNENQF